jgi:hypothetical protein
MQRTSRTSQRAPERQYFHDVTLSVLLDSYVREMNYVPKDAQPITDWQELPVRMQQLTREASEWRAWSAESRVWFLRGRAHEEHPNADEAMLEVSFHSAEGEVVAAGVWQHAGSGQWKLWRVL